MTLWMAAESFNCQLFFKYRISFFGLKLDVSSFHSGYIKIPKVQWLAKFCMEQFMPSALHEWTR